MNLQQRVQKQGPSNIGRYQSRVEDGKLKLYYHQVGRSSGMSCTFSPEETKGLLEMLASHRDDINSALYANGRERSLD